MVIQVNSNTVSDVIKSYRDNKPSAPFAKTAGSEKVKPEGGIANLNDFESDSFAVFSVWHDVASFYDVSDIKISDIPKMSAALYEGGAISLEEHGALSSFGADAVDSEKYINLVNDYSNKLADDFEANDLKSLNAKRNVVEHLKKLDIAKVGAIDIVA